MWISVSLQEFYLYIGITLSDYKLAQELENCKMEKGIKVWLTVDAKQRIFCAAPLKC